MPHQIAPSRNILSLSALALLITGGLLYAGPLTPPAGPVASTSKTIGEVEPRMAINSINTPGDSDSLFKITQRGSYYLTGNITGVANKHGIEITASGVTLDFNGFDLVGVPGMGEFDGVRSAASTLTNIAVINGSVRNWGLMGINLGNFPVIGGRVEGVDASGNFRAGIYGANTMVRCSGTGGEYGIYSGFNATISDCMVSGNSLYGIFANAGSTLTNCVACNNTGDGIVADIGSTVTNCSTYGNSGNGIIAYSCTVIDCTSRSNILDGIRCSLSCLIRGNSCVNNGNLGDGAGIHATGIDNRIEGNNCTGADRGIQVDSGGNFIARNTCRNNPLNWDVVAGNVILVVVGNNAPAVNGIAGGAAPGSTDPNANFTY